jgi:hypothetical protein
MTDYRVRNQHLFPGDRSPPPSLAIVVLFTAIGFVAMFAAISALTGRFNPASGFSPASAPAGSTTMSGRPRP